ncbi:hypothetical protein IQ238_15145 [Pleurocapsales cyanobacterium LEGE 06147]|nr:hypothetical protein [Pleurocapsales cyanobacterium LEGE 06147]
MRESGVNDAEFDSFSGTYNVLGCILQAIAFYNYDMVYGCGFGVLNPCKI